MLKLKLQYFGTWCKGLTHWKRPWCWEKLKVGGEGDNRGWDGWMASLTQWTWVWLNSWSWWWTGRPGVLQSILLQRVGHDWVTELNWQEHYKTLYTKVGTFSSLCRRRNRILGRLRDSAKITYLVTDVLRRQTYIYLGKSYILSIIAHCHHTKKNVWFIYNCPYIRISVM